MDLNILLCNKVKKESVNDWDTSKRHRNYLKGTAAGHIWCNLIKKTHWGKKKKRTVGPY